MKRLISLLTSIFLTGCTVVGIRSSEEPKYQVLNDYGSIQIRQYPELVIAQTEINADYKTSSNQGFQSIAMTAPVIQQKTADTWLMRFVLPKEYTLLTAPIPLDPTVIIAEIPSKKVAVLNYSGSLSEQGIKEKSEELDAWLKAHGYSIISEPQSAAYDPPWTLPFLRRNEIHIEIK